MIGVKTMQVQEQLDELRKQISVLDEQIVPLFIQRMAIALETGKGKAANNLAIVDADREQKVVNQAMAQVDEDLRGETALLMRTIISLAREYQQKLLTHREVELLPPARPPLTADLRCAYQGVPGAWSEQALIKLFPSAEREALEFFEDVFIAVREKRADYGVVAIENSTTGAIGETYDLLRKYGCYIVGRTWIEAKQCLLAVPGTKLTDIREVYSHSEGFRQCSIFLHNRAWDQTIMRNTAVAAEAVAQAQSNRLAAIGSRRAAELNGLEVLVPDMMDSNRNRTSFVVIATQPEYDASSDLISVNFATAHRPGALCEALMPLTATGINMLSIESRPAGAGKYRFFVEIAGNILDNEVQTALRHIAAICEYFEVLGCYREL